MRAIWVTLLWSSLSLAQSGPRANPTPADLAAGQRFYMGACAYCHGPAGEGGRGPNLAVPRLFRATDDQALFRIIRNGIEGTEMPRAWRMLDKEVWLVAAYVRSLGRRPQESVSGDAARGEQIYRSKGNCAQCHIMAGQGGRMGPDLTEIGARRSVEYLRQSLLEPGAAVPTDFLQVTVITRDGRKITGIRLNESTFSVQLRDLNDRFHSFLKSEVAEVRKEKGQSPMLSYKDILAPAEVEDLVAYMVSLRGGL